MTEEEIRRNIEEIKKRIEAAAHRAGRSAAEVQLVAVTKTVPPEKIMAAYQMGLRDFGENRVQEMVKKRGELPADIRWHMIGHLQTNKVKYIVDWVYMIHSLDRPSLAAEISKRAKAVGRTVPCLVEVNVAGEESKFGLAPEEVIDFIREVAQMPGIAVKGLMTVAPYTENPEEVRPVFRRLREIAAQVEAEQIPGVEMRYLSMGMSGDFEVAIEEGAHMVRLGTALFGARQ